MNNIFSEKNMEMVNYLLKNNYIRAVNYHCTGPEDAARFEAEIKYYSKHFSSVTVEDLDYYFDNGKWLKDKPGLIPAVFEGYREAYDVYTPILDKYNFTGWYYIPSFFMDVPVGEQLEFAQTHDLDLLNTNAYSDGRFAMTWDEVRDLSKKHVICCHSGSHFEIVLDTPQEDMHREIVLSKKKLEEELQQNVDVFCWLYGEEFSYNPKAGEHIIDAGYKYVVGNLKMERVQKINKGWKC